MSRGVRLRRRLGVDNFTDTDERMASTAGGQAGVTYSNARSYDEHLSKRLPSASTSKNALSTPWRQPAWGSEKPRSTRGG